MKCYQIRRGSKYVGIPLYERETAHVRVSLDDSADAPKVQLSPKLTELLYDPARRAVFAESSPRIVNCDIEDRSVWWLVDATPETSGERLILLQEEVEFKKGNVGTLEVQVIGEGSRIILNSEQRLNTRFSTTYLEQGFLIHLVPGGSIRITRSQNKPRSILGGTPQCVEKTCQEITIDEQEGLEVKTVNGRSWTSPAA